MTLLAIVGTVGHSTIAADIAILNSYQIVGFYDNFSQARSAEQYLGSVAAIRDSPYKLICAIGDNAVRKKVTNMTPDEKWMTLVHPSAVVAESASIGTGTIVCAGAVVQPCCIIGKQTIINTRASIDHQCIIGDYCHIAPGSTLCGNVHIADSTFVGAGTTIINEISVGENVLIGAHSLVIRNIANNMKVFGIPAKVRN